MAENIRNELQLSRLEKNGLVIESEFKDQQGRTYSVSTDGKKKDTIRGYELKQKRYYKQERCIHREKKFQEIAYKYILQQDKETQIHCPNCGYAGNLEEFVVSCPYCETEFNVPYTTKRTGGKQMSLAVEKIRQFPVAVIKFTIGFYIVWSIICLLFGEPAGLFVGVFLSIVVGLHVYMFGSIVVAITSLIKIGEISHYGTVAADIRQWIPGFNYDSFLTMANDAILRNTLEGDEAVIDTDILDYKKITGMMFQDGIVVRLQVKLRKVFYENGKIRKKIRKQMFAFKHHPERQFVKTPAYRVIMCKNCGDSVDLSAGRRCESCGTIVEGMEEWSLTWAEESGQE